MTQFVSLIFACTVFIFPVFSQAPPADFLLDLNQDGGIDSKDLLILIQRWGTEGIATPTPTPVATETPTNPDSISIVLPAPLIKMVRIPAGSFMMGSPDTERGRNETEGPVQQVTIDYEFYLGETEVTQVQWEAVMGYNPATQFPDGSPRLQTFGVGPDFPVYYVSWDECQAFIAALNALLGKGKYRLPSEAEWEYACRAGTTTRFYFGDSLSCPDDCSDCSVSKGVIGVDHRSDYMWYCGNSGYLTHPVRQHFPNLFGLYDMSGNVLEWCLDSFLPGNTGAPTDGRVWKVLSETSKSIRGGAFGHDARDCRSASRSSADPASRSGNVGFRLAWIP